MLSNGRRGVKASKLVGPGVRYNNAAVVSHTVDKQLARAELCNQRKLARKLFKLLTFRRVKRYRQAERSIMVSFLLRAEALEHLLCHRRNGHALIHGVFSKKLVSCCL